MFCTRCGRAVPEGARFCPNCGAAVTVVTPPEPEAAEPSPYAPPPGEAVTPPVAAWTPPAVEPAVAPPQPAPPATYGPPPFSPYAGGGTPATAAAPVLAGFWRRFWAVCLDGILLNVLLSPLYLTWVAPVLMSHPDPENMDPSSAFTMLGTLMSYVFVGTLLEFIYYAALESSVYQASLGKLALGIRVTDLEGRRITFVRALLRRLARIVSNLTFGIGYLMNVWTRRRQTLHDLMAGTLVVRRSEDPS